MWNARFLCGLTDAARHFVHNHIVVCGIAANQTSETDDRIVFFGLRQGTGGGRNFESSRHTNNRDVFLSGTQTNQAIVSAAQQSLGNKFVEPGDYDRKSLAGRAEMSRECGQLGKALVLLAYLFRKLCLSDSLRRSLSLELRRTLLQKRFRPLVLIFRRATQSE